MTAGQVGGDGLRAGVKAGFGQLLAQGHDLLFPAAGDPGGRVMRPPRPRRQPGRALPAVAGQQLVQPAAADPVRGRQLGDRPPGPQVRLDQELALVHRRPPALKLSPMS